MKPFCQIPIELFNLRCDKKISEMAVLVYQLIVRRMSITKFKDKRGSYIVLTYEQILKEVKRKDKTVLSKALKELEEYDFIKIIRTEKTNKYYII